MQIYATGTMSVNRNPMPVMTATIWQMIFLQSNEWITNPQFVSGQINFNLNTTQQINWWIIEWKEKIKATCPSTLYKCHKFIGIWNLSHQLKVSYEINWSSRLGLYQVFAVNNWKVTFSKMMFLTPMDIHFT